METAGKERIKEYQKNHIWFTSDTHFNHANIIKYCDRPFSNVEEMNDVLIANWNSCVQKNDIVYHLGDFGFGIIEPILKRLKGQIHFIIGSHDKNTQCCKHLFASYSPLKEIKIEENVIVLCHYALRTWAKSHYNSWSCYGHSHFGLPEYGKSICVSVDVHNYYPFSYDEIKEKMITLPDNFNLVRERKYG